MANIANVKVKQGNILSLSGSSVEITGSTTVGSDLNVVGTITAGELIVNTITTASTVFTSGSTQFGNEADDTHTFSGSVNVSGTLSASFLVGDGSGLINLDLGGSAVTAISGGANINVSSTTGAVTASLASSISVTNVTATDQVSGSVGKFATLSASNAEFSGSVLIIGTASLAALPTAAYVRYESNSGSVVDKIVIFPGFYASGSSEITGNLNVTGTVSASLFSGSGAGLTNLPAGQLSGSVQLDNGGTGIDASSITSGQLLIGSGSSLAVGELVSGSNIVVTKGSGSITVELTSSVTGLTSLQTDTLTVNTTAALTGQIRLSITSVTASYTVQDTDSVLMVNNTGSITIALPSEDVPAGRVLIVKKNTSSTDTVTLDGIAVDGESTFELNGPYQSVTLIADNDEWFIT